MKCSVEVEVGGRPLTIECGHMATQASGAVVMRYGDTVVLVAATKEDRIREGIDFLPLMVDYQEMSYAVGRIPGGFFRREIGRPSEKETLTSRLIDRPIRPLFPKKYFYETQVTATVLSVDLDNEPDVVALTGASAALHISGPRRRSGGGGPGRKARRRTRHQSEHQAVGAERFEPGRRREPGRCGDGGGGCQLSHRGGDDRGHRFRP